MTHRLRRILVAASVLSVAPILWVLLQTVDRTSLTRVWQSLSSDPIGLVVALAAFGAAFGLRAVAWHKILPDLAFGQALAALHVSLAANHVLPFRMGEPLRVVSVARRARIRWGAATASTVTLRAADVVTLAALGAWAGLGRLGGSFPVWLVAGGAVLAAALGIGWLLRLRRRGEKAVLPGPVALIATAAAWALESVVIWQAAIWAGAPLTAGEAMMATAAAVIAQVVAFTPGGFGTYEAGGTAALVIAGQDAATALAVVVTAHAVKTLYSLATGAVALFVPDPGFFGRLRLSPSQTPAEDWTEPEANAPVVLFMPAHDEAACVSHVVSRVPAEVQGRQVVCLVIDDGSTDATAEEARQAGATVVSLGSNHGLGAAVRQGMREALARRPAAIAFCDADGEYAPEELGRMVEPILGGEADYVVGSRFTGDIQRMHLHRRLGNRMLTLVLSWVARRWITDGQSGYRAFSPRGAAAAEIIHDFNYAQVLTLDLLAKGMTYTEVPISYSFRTTGRSFIRLGRYLRSVVPAVYRELNTT
ncbi:MAG TPA: lysylphosphatidylglycerol synthase domain-containing protein [Acidimicrobiia bacterium]|nr:lysylphosphatidylglycerol synthase domain-containing protein [Acidimicrobiia bacterium]